MINLLFTRGKFEAAAFLLAEDFCILWRINERVRANLYGKW
jgi:hypothetical protein